MANDFGYWAFISYSHADASYARALHRRLEAYRLPKSIRLREKLPPRLFPIFLDREELPSSDTLAENIKTALRQSRHLIILWSSHAAASKWVEAELRHFESLGRTANISFVSLRDQAVDTADISPFSKRVDESPFLEHSTQPLIVGSPSSRETLLRLAAAIALIPYRELSRRDRRRALQRRAGIVLTSMMLVVVGGTSLIQFSRLRDERNALLPKSPSPAIVSEQRSLAATADGLHRTTGMSMTLTTEGFVQVIDLGPGTFQIAQGDLRPDADQVIAGLAREIVTHQYRHLSEIQIVAHADATPMSASAASNWELTGLRASRIARRLQEFGIDPLAIRITPIAPGEYGLGPPLVGPERRRTVLRLIYSDQKPPITRR